jgi:ABC-type oligopeptide transport system substrate-binding subunit
LKKLFLFLTVAFMVFGITACELVDDTTDPEVDPPVLSGVEDVEVFVGGEFDPLEGVTAFDEVDEDLTDEIVVTGEYDLTQDGSYTLVYTVTNSGGKTATEARTLTVVSIELTMPTGFYNYRFASADLRHTFFAAAEKYLLNTMDGGIPVFANAGFNLYSSRLQLPVEDYIPVMGFGTSYATMSEDDSTVIMDDNQPGNEGEYTYRSALGQNPTTLHQWIYDDATSSDVITLFLDSPYYYNFNEAMDGYDLLPSMASDYPQPLESEVTETGIEVANTWRVSLRDDLTWTYHPDTDTSGFPEGHEHINAHDFIETYRIALTEGWFRAISGGGDFLTASQRIVNAREFRDETAEWEDVGLRAVDDYTLEFEFVNEMAEWNVRYWLGSFVMGPINLDLYDLVGEQYGTSAETTAYNGEYQLDYYEPDSIVRYSKNPNFHDPDRSFFTHWTYRIIEDAEIRFQEFLAGKLEAASVPTESYDQYKNSPLIKRVPGSTTFRIMINGLGTEEAQREQFPDSTWEPEPILANQDFKRAMYFAIDRQRLAEEVMKTSQTQQYLFTDAYLVEPASGTPFRNTEESALVDAGLSTDTFGYNPDLAKAYFESAIDDLVADGVYEPGTQGEPTVINIDLNIFSGSVAQQLFGEFIQDSFEFAFQSFEHNIKVEVTPTPKDFPSIYYDYMMVGEFDLSIGGISGSTLDAASFLDVFTSDNRGGFTLNWGIDTSIPEIEVQYENPYLGETVRELWSYDAIVSALNGEIYVSEGAEAEVPAAKDFETTPTTATFTIDQFDNTGFENITYTVQYYDPEAGYLDVEGLVDVVPEAATVTVEGLLPAFDDYPTTYLGDYQVVINFGYTADPDREGQSVSPWWMQPSIIEASEEVEVTETSAVLNVTLNEDDYAREVTEVEVLDYADYSATDAVVDFADLEAVALTGLAADTTYQVIFTFDDGNVAYLLVTTEAPAEE